MAHTHTCKVCNEKFTVSNILKCHMLIHTSVRSLNYYLASHVNKLIERLIPFDISYYLAFHSHLSQFICRLKYKVGLRFSMEGTSVECCLVMLCCSDLIDIQLSVDEKPNEDLTQRFIDKSRGLSQTSHSTEQSVFSSECVRVDTSSQLDTAEDCKQFHAHECPFSCNVCNEKFTQSRHLKYHMRIHSGEMSVECGTHTHL